MHTDSSLGLGQLQGMNVTGSEGARLPLGEFLTQSHTTEFLVIQGGERVAHWSADPAASSPVAPLFSISKSVVGVIAGALIERGDLDPNRWSATYVPEIAGGGYRGTSVRDLLDMRTGGDHHETHDAGGELAHLVATQDGSPQAPYGSVHDMVSGIERVGRHEGPFCYRSLDTEALGWVIERATGVAMDVLADEMVFGPLGCVGAVFAKDVQGDVIHSGGLAMSAADVAKLGTMILNSGAIGGHQVVSPYFVKDLRQGNPGDADSETQGSYRNQFWVPQRGGRELLALGVHGQMLWMDGASDTVLVKLSTWPEPSNPALLSATYACARACAAARDGGANHDIAVRR
ncbi:MAG: serine hydrolase [Ornithinimicrobium sp.]